VKRTLLPVVLGGFEGRLYSAVNFGGHVAFGFLGLIAQRAPGNQGQGGESGEKVAE